MRLCTPLSIHMNQGWLLLCLQFEIDDEEMWRVGHKTYNLSLLQSVKGKEAKFMATLS